MNTGERGGVSAHGLLTTVGYQIGRRRRSTRWRVPSPSPARWSSGCGTISGLIRAAAEIEALARSVDDNGGCYFVPAFSGLFAPYWRSDARGVIAGLTAYVTRGHIARAALEAAAWQTREVVDAMAADSGEPLTVLRWTAA